MPAQTAVPKTIDFVFFDAGGGHRSAALALQSVIEKEGYPWTVRLLNLQEILDEMDVFRKLTGIRLQDIYNLMLAKGWTLGSEYLLGGMHGVIRLYHSKQVKMLSEYWSRNKPDMVVSLIPNFNRALYQSLRKTLGNEVPYVTVLTDMADYPPHFWMEKQPDQYFICGTDRAVKQAAAIGHPSQRTLRASGMILRPTFYERLDSDRRRDRENIGLDPDLPTSIVLFGGEGSGVMYPIAEQLGNSKLDLQLVVICGKNTKLKSRLQTLQTRNRIHVEGFTREIPRYMRMADFFIGKPGPGSISEALHMGLPVIVEKNAWTLPQERFNAHWVRENGVGAVLPNFQKIEAAVQEMLEPGRLESMRARIAQLSNRAVFEVPQFLAQIFGA